MANIQINTTSIKVLTEPMKDWLNPQYRDLTADELAVYGTEIQSGYGVQCGGVIVMQTMGGERTPGMFGRESLPGDLIVETDYVIRGLDSIAWQWRPDGARNEGGVMVPAPTQATRGTLEVRSR